MWHGTEAIRQWLALLLIAVSPLVFAERGEPAPGSTPLTAAGTATIRPLPAGPALPDTHSQATQLPGRAPTGQPAPMSGTPGDTAVPPAPPPVAEPMEPAPQAPPPPDRPRPDTSGSLWPAGMPPLTPARPAATPAPAADVPDREPGIWLVTSADLPSARTLESRLRQQGWTLHRRQVLRNLGMVVSTFRLPDGTTDEDARALVATIRPEAVQAPNHRYLPLGRAGEGRIYAAELMGWPADRTGCGDGARIGVLDGALPQSHPLLARTALHPVLPAGVSGGGEDHALAVASIFSAPETGLVPAARLFWVPVLRRQNDAADTLAHWVLDGLDWLAGQQVQVINLSLGGPPNALLEVAVKQLIARDIVIVAAVGNQGPDHPPLYPARFPAVTGVTAVDAALQVFRDANQGDGVDFAAPGVDLWLPRTDGHAYQSGTSWAAPHVAALIAWYRATTHATASATHQWLVNHVQDLGRPGPDPVYGHGLPRFSGTCSRPGH